MKPLLQAKHVRKVYANKGSIFTALHDIDITIFEGEFVGIMGPSGSGKTTLLNILSTIDMPTAGEIIINDSTITKMKEEQLTAFRRDSLGFIFQEYNLLDTLTIKDNILLPLAIRNTAITEIDRRVDEIATLFSIQELLNKYPYQISGGQKQRIAAARAIIGNPKLVLADEPTGALDSKSATDLLNSFQTLNEKNLATILMVTHDPFAASYCKRVLFIKDGQIYTELVKGDMSRKEFFQKLLHILSALGGGVIDTI
ncbi:ABC transporter ATP-binding protein [Lysinibacillus sp. RC79]|uniref:ABC transporter ATP-binding protein n=1 Tax=Lysinibacillus sp. RC79 TaxID=3156296 RepID=UPI00351851DC